MKVGDVFVCLPPSLLAAVEGGQAPPPAAAADLAALADGAHPLLLRRDAQLGEQFELAPLPAWVAWLAGAGSGFPGAPLQRAAEKQPDGTLSVALRPVLLRLAGAGGGRGGELLCPRRAPPSAVLKRVHAALGADAPPLDRLRLWLVGGAAAAAAGAAAPPRALLAGARALEEWLSEEEATSCVCARVVEHEVRQEDGAWPLGDTTRAVRARAAWPESPSIAPEVKHLSPKDPLRNLVEYAEEPYGATGSSWNTMTMWTKPAAALPRLYEVKQLFKPYSEGPPRQSQVSGELLAQGALEDDGYKPEVSVTIYNVDKWEKLQAPLTGTPPFRSRLRVGDALLARVPKPSSGIEKGDLEWQPCVVVAIDHGAYPPLLSLAIERAPRPLVISLESAALRAGGVGRFQADAWRPEGVSIPAAAAFDGLPTLAAGELPPISKASCDFPVSEADGGSLALALAAAAGAADPEAARAQVLDACLAPLEEGYLSTYKYSWGSGEAGAHGMHGLQNLGNTCFMNSILQCLSAVEPLSRFFLSPSTELQGAINEVNEMSYGGRIAVAWAAFIRAQRKNRKGETLVPSTIKELVSEKAAHFIGFQQHDSEEFARFLLDFLMEDTTRNKSKKKPAVASPDTPGMPDADLARAEWANYQLRNGSPVSDLFAGSYVSKVKCLTCSSVSTKCDPFTSLQVPLAAADRVNFFEFYTVDAQEGWKTKWKLYFEPDKTGPLTVAQLCAWVDAQRADIAASRVAKVAGFLSAEVAAAAQALVGGTAATSWAPVLVCDVAERANCDRQSIDRSLALDENVSLLDVAVYTPMLLEVPQLQPPRTTGGAPPPDSFAVVQLRCKNSTWTLAPFPNCFPIYEPFAVALPPGATQKQAADAVFARMQRFMSANAKQAYTAAEPPYSLLRCRPPRGAGEAVAHGAANIYSTVPAVRAPRIAYFRDGAAPVGYDEAAPLGGPCSLLVDADLTKIAEKDFPATTEGTPKGLAAWAVALPGHSTAQAAPPVKPQDLRSCLARNELAERMDGVNQVYCRTCKEHRDGEKSLRVWRLPPILLIQLKRYSRREAGGGGGGGRFDFYGGGGVVVKNSAVVKFPCVGLDMADFVLGSDHVDLPDIARPAGPWPADAPAPQPQPAGGKLLYDLFAVSQHSGSLSGGHYTAAAQDWETGRWHSLNDSTEAPLAGPEGLASTSAYILFYRRRDTEGPAVLAANLALEAKEAAGAAAGGGGGGGGGGAADSDEDAGELD